MQRAGIDSAASRLYKARQARLPLYLGTLWTFLTAYDRGIGTVVKFK